MFEVIVSVQVQDDDGVAGEVWVGGEFVGLWKADKSQLRKAWIWRLVVKGGVRMGAIMGDEEMLKAVEAAAAKLCGS